MENSEEKKENYQLTNRKTQTEARKKKTCLLIQMAMKKKGGLQMEKGRESLKDLSKQKRESKL